MMKRRLTMVPGSPMESALDWVSRWYDDSIPYPVEGRAFLKFIVGNYELAQTIRKDVKLEFNGKVKSACTDGTTIYLPTFYLNWKFYDFLGIPDEYIELAATACINGTQLHEAKHCMVSPCDIRDAIKLSAAAVKLEEAGHGKLFRSAFNTIEDLWIEWRMEVDNFQTWPFVDAKNEILMSPRTLDRMTDELEDPELTKQQFMDILSVLKLKRVQDDDEPVPGLLPFIDLVRIPQKDYRRCDTPSDRVDLAVRLTKAVLADARLKDEPPGEPDEDESDDKDKSEGDGDGSGGGKGAGELASLIDALSAMAGLDDAATQEFQASQLGAAADRLADMANKMLYDSKEHDRIMWVHKHAGELDLSRMSPLKFVDVIEAAGSRHESNIEPDTKWLSLGRHIRQARAVNHTPGRPRTEGSDVDVSQLHRIATDGMILTQRDGRQVKRGAPELILLDDCSGSMCSTYRTGKSETLLQTVAAATLGAFLSMVEARLPVAVYGHTTYDGHSAHDGVYLFGVAAYDMPLMTNNITITGDAKRRFRAMVDAPSSANADGVALEYVGKRFTARPGSKMLAVVSDGRPSSDGYGGMTGIAHTASIANALRKKGIAVVSFSLIEGVVEDNDRIYGQENNIRAFGDKLDASLRDLVRRVSGVSMQLR